MPKNPAPPFDPATTPAGIEARSFALIDAAVPEPRPYTGRLWQIARRLIHTSGDVALLKDIVLTEAAVDAGIAALGAGCRVYTDTEMARVGMTRIAPSQSRCIFSLPGIADTARLQGITRARAGVLSLREHFGGTIVAIGNAPTALHALLEILHAGAPVPALIIGMPVGFVNAAESKEWLCQSPYPYITIRGNKGGSTLAAAAINALALLA